MTKKRQPNRVKRSDSRQHLTCESPGCTAKQVAKGLCRYHWQNARLNALRGPAGRRMYYRKMHNGLPDPTRPEPDKCECCGVPLKQTGKHSEVPHLDHDHTTGAFRGWLCNRCNLGIGFLGDSIAGLMQAVRYLQNAELL